MSEEKKNPPRAQIFRYFCIESRNNNNVLDPPETSPQRESKDIFSCEDTSSQCLGVKWDHLVDTMVASRVDNRSLRAQKKSKLF